MQIKTHDGGLTTTDDHVPHDPGCASVAHPDMTCAQAKIAFRTGRRLIPQPRKVPDASPAR